MSALICLSIGFQALTYAAENDTRTDLSAEMTTQEISVETVTDQIKQLPPSTEVTKADQELVQKIEAEYQSLSEEDQKKVTNADKLKEALLRIEELNARVEYNYSVQIQPDEADAVITILNTEEGLPDLLLIDPDNESHTIINNGKINMDEYRVEVEEGKTIRIFLQDNAEGRWTVQSPSVLSVTTEKADQPAVETETKTEPESESKKSVTPDGEKTKEASWKQYIVLIVLGIIVLIIAVAFVLIRIRIRKNKNPKMIWAKKKKTPNTEVDHSVEPDPQADDTAEDTEGMQPLPERAQIPQKEIGKEESKREAKRSSRKTDTATEPEWQEPDQQAEMARLMQEMNAVYDQYEQQTEQSRIQGEDPQPKPKQTIIVTQEDIDNDVTIEELIPAEGSDEEKEKEIHHRYFPTKRFH